MLLLSFVWFYYGPLFGGRGVFKAALMPRFVVFRISVLIVSAPKPHGELSLRMRAARWLELA